MEGSDDMAQYIMLLTLTPEGRQKMLNHPDLLLQAESEINIPDVQTLGVYALLGDYDYACILNAPGNREAARFSLELGVKAGVLITTMPIIPLGSFDQLEREDAPAEEAALDPQSDD